ncbi:hypothetical protein C5C03_00475 [Clavibacter michiganensis]|uniref:hypothetical protein n=1 Tax=Clavibacter michiganensis TaxID=28447 RepID=UPI000CE83E08|nr:hypothetical protein [Clavibacter michiganensis]PPF91333.1 hypothetical protein C5C03_00475 [Clavibacter michiganensis]PPF99375.1 hypothetical protein C5C05_02275 [Clavibacter michiganensis]
MTITVIIGSYGIGAIAFLSRLQIVTTPSHADAWEEAIRLLIQHVATTGTTSPVIALDDGETVPLTVHPDGRVAFRPHGSSLQPARATTACGQLALPFPDALHPRSDAQHPLPLFPSRPKSVATLKLHSPRSDSTPTRAPRRRVGTLTKASP